METLYKFRWRDPVGGVVHQVRGYELREELGTPRGREFLTYRGVELCEPPRSQLSFLPLTCQVCLSGDWLLDALELKEKR